MPKQLLVTGATGFIATHCIVDLLNNGYQVRGTVRNLNSEKHIRTILERHTQFTDNFEIAHAELTDPHSWTVAMRGCHGVLHIASPVPVIQPKNADKVIRPALEGTMNVLKAAKDLNVSRVVMTSSVAAVWGKGLKKSRVYSESDWTDINNPEQSPYSLSKTLAEKAAWKFVKGQGNPELVVINPSVVLGPALESDYGSSLIVLYKLLKGQLPMLPKLGFEIVDVRDVAVLHRLAYESSEAIGHRFLCSSGFRWLKEMALFLRENFPDYRKRITVRDMPNFLARIYSFFDGSVKRFLPDLEIKREMDVSTARTVLGWHPRSPEEAIKSGAQSLIDLGVV
ncbi:MAG: aldehyde reductase [Desulfobacterales bacterium]|jgi:nucleoside-diphosphate-sugar epimerase